MKKTIFLLLICLQAASQTDTIFTKDRQVIVGTISTVNKYNLFYRDTQQIGRVLPSATVIFYSKNGKRNYDLKNQRQTSQKNIDSVNVTDELAYMRMCMSKFHNQYSTGMGITLVGGAITGCSFFVGEDGNMQRIMGLGGLVMMVVGTVTSVDAHRWFGKAGWGVSGKGNMVEVRYRFK